MLSGPDGHWVEVIKGPLQNTSPSLVFAFAQTCLRVSNPTASLAFYCDGLGMQLLEERHYPGSDHSPGFSLYFLAYLPAGVAPPLPGTQAARDLLRSLGGRVGVLELCHNHTPTRLQQGPGLSHLCFLAHEQADAAALAQARATLREVARGSACRLESVGDEGTPSRESFFDPDGVPVVIVDASLPTHMHQYG